MFIRNMITDRIGRNEVLFPIYHKFYDFREKKIETEFISSHNFRFGFCACGSLVTVCYPVFGEATTSTSVCLFVCKDSDIDISTCFE